RRPRFRWTKRATRSAPEPESPWSKFVLSRPANPMEQRHRHAFVQPHGKRERSLLEKRAEPVRGAMAVAARSGALVGAPLPVVHVEQDGIPVDRVPEGLWGRHSGREHRDPGANDAWTRGVDLVPTDHARTVSWQSILSTPLRELRAHRARSSRHDDLDRCV